MTGDWHPLLAPGGHVEPRDSAYHRYEYKFPLPLDRREEVLERIAPHVRHDEYCRGAPGHRYVVSSIYFDTEDLRFYREKLDGVRVRRKLRVRAYGRPSGDCLVFLEIKRKRGARGLKERLPLGWERAVAALHDGVPDAPRAEGGPSARRVLESFRFHLCSVGLRPVVLVSYRREAFVDPECHRVRVTMDDDLRSRWAPSLDQLGEQRGLEPVAPDRWILEFKFDDRPPRWMAQVMSSLGLRREPFSKFCHGIDACVPADVIRRALGRKEI